MGAGLAANTAITFTLPTPFPILNNGTLYRIVVTNTTAGFEVRVNAPSDYADGDITGNTNSHSGCCDLDFLIQIQAANAPDPNIPTLGEWGLINLAFLLLIFGVMGIREMR